MAPAAANGRQRTPSPSRLPLPGSPTHSYASTTNQLSSLNLPLPPPPRPAHTVLTKADLEQSQLAYADLLATAKSYRVALASLSTAASAFGSALESCARLKESRADSLLHPSVTGRIPNGTSTAHHTMPGNSNSYSKSSTCTADHLLSTSGVHHLIANHQQILSETVYRSFEVPLLHDLDKWKTDIEDAEETYNKEVVARSREIRRLEKDGMKMHKAGKRRDLSKFREHLVTLTGKLDGLSTVHADHALALLKESQEASAKILDASCSLVRAEVDIFESLARKGWTGGGLDELLEKGKDLFATDDEALHAASAGSTIHDFTNQQGFKNGLLFGILPPKSILSVPSDTGAVWGAEITAGDELWNSQIRAVANGDGEMDDNESIFSQSNHSRGVRPFSPQPIRRQAANIIMDPEALLAAVDGEFRDQRDVEAEASAEGERGEDEETEVCETEGGDTVKGDNGFHDGGDKEAVNPEKDDEDAKEDERNATLRPSSKMPASLQDARLSEDEGQMDVSPGREEGEGVPKQPPWLDAEFGGDGAVANTGHMTADDP
ncbi:hypothetical protein F4808DRAFT_442646 [Astrocystis sublimbata]|nr:hypothetical protein F4808DRAFT_442646 [Astrocystis sublimbata]